MINRPGSLVVLLALVHFGCQSAPPSAADRAQHLELLDRTLKHDAEARDAYIKAWMKDCTAQGKVLGLDQFQDKDCVPDPKAQQAAASGKPEDQKAVAMHGTVKVPDSKSTGPAGQ